MSKLEFNKSRLTLARKRRHHTKTSLSKICGLTVRSLTSYESPASNDVPSNATLEKLSNILDFPIDFFFQDETESPTPDNASFRSFSRLTATQRDSALASGSIAFLLNDWIEDRFNLPPFSVPDLSGFRAEEAAEIIRTEWGIGDKPIANVVHLLESKGVRVFSLMEDTKEVNAFSCWKGGHTPFVFLNTYKSAESSRFDAAHELGHLVLHRHGDNKGKGIENEANAFASAFLMPATSILRHASSVKSVDQILVSKKSWGVSAIALAFRLNRLGLLTDWVYRSICIEMSTRGMRTQEPEPIPRESSQIISKIFNILRKDGIGIFTIAKDLKIGPEEIQNLLFGLATIPVNGNPTKPRSSKTAENTLTIVK
ncbi:helix-turn-helix domain-containing protein [Vreelandella utahensis]|uniref:helix-turn-helix domain-containing protein n=1 Tax=Vreelandella halophila TaxID=86177 RepID=UPI000986C8A1|nr:XRE family transcriptional regulator [Halomonas utahensis]